MRQYQLYSIGPLSVIDVTGADASNIVHNVTTNEIRSLNQHEGNESFITDVRGKTLAHVVAFRIDGGIRLIGPPGFSERVRDHLDKYTIVEDATPTIRDDEFAAIVVDPTLAVSLNEGSSSPSIHGHRSIELGSASVTADLYGCRWLGEDSGLILVPHDQVASAIEELSAKHQAECGEESDFHDRRIAAGFPWYGVDLTDANLPQEADRDKQAISFTKGCYLGQETVARLDALGQVQKKLVTWSVSCGVPDPGTPIVNGEKTVGRLTSVAATEGGGAIAIGPARRTHFDPGSKGTCEIEGSDTLEATVLP